MLALALCVAFAGAGPVEEAEPPSATVEGAEQPALVEVHVVAGPEEFQRLERALPDFLGELDAELGIDRRDNFDLEEVLRAPEREVVAGAWVDVSKAGAVRVFIVDADAEHVFIRALEAGDELDVVVVDEVGHLLASAFEALLAGGTIGITQEQARTQLAAPEPEAEPETEAAPQAEPEAEPEPDAEPKPESARRFSPGVSAGYVFSALGSGAFLHGPGLRFSGGTKRGAWRLGGELEGRFYAPALAAEEGPIALRLSGGGLRARPGAEWSRKGTWGVAMFVGGGVDLVRDEPIAQVEEAEAFEPRVRAAGMLDLGVGPLLRVGSTRDQVVVRLLVTADVAVASHTYRTANTGTVVLDPWILRPGVRLFVGWGR